MTEKPLRLFTCTDHEGHWPTGVASIVLAYSEPQARSLLQRKLKSVGLPHTGFTLEDVPLALPKAIILYDGEY